LCGCDKYHGGGGVDLFPKKTQKIETDDWEWCVRPKEGKRIFLTVEFHHSVNKIPRSNGLFIYSLQFWARRRGGGLKRNQGKGGPGIHQKIFAGLLVPDKQSFALRVKTCE
jgi:hypothetical protein